MHAPLTHRLRAVIGLPLLIVALVAGGSTGLAGLQLTAAPQAPATEVVLPRQDVLGEQAGPTPSHQASSVDEQTLAAWTEQVPDARAHWVTLAAPRPAPKPAPKARAANEDTTQPKASSTTSNPPKSGQKAADHSGTNHFWMPSLGINRTVHAYPCPRTRPPDNYLYRWGCAGANNVYLLGHAYSVMDPLHDAYVGGRLRTGMAAWYATGGGKVREYRITEWRVVRPDEAAWAIADQPVPSMTLQTCVGKNDAYRLVVRLVAVG
jgi:hypothetical protein